ncbi:hypothetical protein HQ489_04465 [Candidatus Woesearchaeota archaeon]|nr:hypothetical protein [Candidatus Woesearchaeota archaeon]
MRIWKKSIIFITILIVLIFSVAALSKELINPFILEEHPSPSNWIKENQIQVSKNEVTLNIKNSMWAKFTNTNSMDPFLDEDSNAIEILPNTADEINVGDVISYQSSYGVIIHRVIEKSSDREGIYYITKGDNSPFKDPKKIRFEEVKGVVVAIIY